MQAVPSARSTASGPVLEMAIKSTLRSKGFDVVPYAKWVKNKEAFGDELLLTNVPYPTIYNHNGKTEFLLLSKKHELKIRIECKWQQRAGSVDEKLPYLYLNAIFHMPEKDIFIVIDGAGWKRGAIPWLKEVINNKKFTEAAFDKNIKVFNLPEFLTWLNTNLR